MRTFARDQILESETKITALATEIVATIPQLSGYKKLLAAYPSPTEQLSTSHDGAPVILKPGQAQLATSTQTVTMGMAPHLLFAPSFEQDPPPSAVVTKATPVLFSMRRDEKIHPDKPVPNELHVSPPPLESTYHMLFHLYNLREVRHLPPPMSDWIGGRISWLESNAAPKYLDLLQEMQREFWPM